MSQGAEIGCGRLTLRLPADPFGREPVDQINEQQVAREGHPSSGECGVPEDENVVAQSGVGLVAGGHAIDQVAARLSVPRRLPAEHRGRLRRGRGWAIESCGVCGHHVQPPTGIVRSSGWTVADRVPDRVRRPLSTKPADLAPPGASRRHGQPVVAAIEAEARRLGDPGAGRVGGAEREEGTKGECHREAPGGWTWLLVGVVGRGLR